MKAGRSISAVVLAFLVLFSSTSLVVGMHHCMGEIESIVLFGKATGCERQQSMPPCHRDISCCDDETVVHQADDFNASSPHSSVVVGEAEDAQMPLVLSEIIPTTPLSYFRFYSYDPPLRSYDLTVAHRVFLI